MLGVALTWEGRDGMFALWMMVPESIRKVIMWIGLGVAAFVTLKIQAKREAREDLKADADREKIERLETREEIENEIEQDVDLAERARRIGLQRAGE